MKWINFMCREDIALKNFEFVTYTTPNIKAQQLIEDEEIRNSEVAFPDAKTLDRCMVYQYLGSKTDSVYNELWKKVKAAE
jgi:spermidine/putrescine transport system permease protein